MMRLLIQRGELESEFEKSVGVLVLLPLRANPFVGRIRTFCDMILLWELAKNLPNFPQPHLGRWRNGRRNGLKIRR